MEYSVPGYFCNNSGTGRYFVSVVGNPELFGKSDLPAIAGLEGCLSGTMLVEEPRAFSKPMF